MKKSVISLIFLLLFIVACEEETYITCPDNVTKVLDISSCPVPKPTCPECNDNDSCTTDSCSAATNYECLYTEIEPCDGNWICEEGEFPWSGDCPSSCDDDDSCTEDTYSYFEDRCIYEDIIPCCGNTDCEAGETFLDCPSDCEQLLDVLISGYRETEKIGNIEVSLMNTDYNYLIVEFKMHNLLIDDIETLNYKEENGFYYDPYKMRVQDSKGNFYDVEYDSDLLANWRYYDIVPKGGTVGGALLFIIPKSAEHVRLIIYDKYGRRLDSAEIF